MKRYSIKGEQSDDLRSTLLLNYKEIFQQLNSLLKRGYDTNMKSLKETNQFVLLTMILICSVSIGNLLSMSPIFYYNQSRKEEFLKLFATFPRDKISNMIDSYEEAIHDLLKSYYFSKSQKNEELPFVSQDIKFKKRSIAQTSRISRIKAWLIVIQLLGFSLFLVYPSLKLYYGNQSYDQHYYGSRELFVFAQSLFLWSSTQGLLFTSINAQLQNFSPSIQNTLHSFMGDLLVMNQNSLNSYYELQDQFTKQRWLQQEFDDIIVTTVEKNGCDGVFNHLIYLGVEQTQQLLTSKITKDDCIAANQRIFTDGMIFVLKEYFSIANEVWQDGFLNSQINNQNDFINVIRQLDEKYDFCMIQDSYFVFQEILGALIDVNYQIQNNVYDQMYQIELLLFIYIIVIIIFIFGFGWHFFIHKLNKSFIKTRQILCLMPFETIVENPYIMSYISKNSSLQV